MSTPSRRTTLKLGTAAIVVGPSVMFSRTAEAGVGVIKFGGHKASEFTVKIAGVYDEVPGVISVDLGSAALDGIKGIQYSGVKIVLAKGTDAAKMTIKWAPELSKQKKGASELKISVSLLRADGKTPGVTYDATGAVPISVVTDEAGDQLLWYKIGSLKRTDHQTEVAGWKLPQNAFKVEIEGLDTTAGFSMTKAVYDWIGGAKQSVYDGVSVKIAASKPVGGDIKGEDLKTKHKGEIEIESYVAVGAGGIDASKLGTTVTKLKIEAAPKGKPPGGKHFAFAHGTLTSIEFPKLATGSDALVTESLTFTVEPSKG